MTANRHILRTHDKLFIAWCGHKAQSEFWFSNFPDRSDTCPKCSSKYYADQLGNDFAYRLGDRVPQEEFSAYKSVYQIIQKSDESVRGFVVIKNGWGKSWSVRALESNPTLREARDGIVPEPSMSRDDIRYQTEKYQKMVSGNSKEEVLLLVPTLVEQGKLPSSSELAATARANIEEMRQQMAARDARQARRADDKQLITEEFATLLASELTNRQRTAIMMAAKQLDIEVAL